MDDLIRDALCNELKLALLQWETLNERAQNNLSIDKSAYDALRLKVQGLTSRLEEMSATQ